MAASISTRRKSQIVVLIIFTILAAIYYVAIVMDDSRVDGKHNSGKRLGEPNIYGSALSVRVGQSQKDAVNLRPYSGSNNAVTFRPSERRETKLYKGPTDSFNRPPNWWLYARSEQEVQWLNQYGFPTPSEELKLKASSDLELQQLAESGDLNAKSHQLARLVKTAFDQQDLRQASQINAQVGRLLGEGGTYQAMTVLSSLGETMSKFVMLNDSEKTQQQLDVLQEYSGTISMALAIGQVYGDYTLLGVYNDYPALVARRAFGIDDTRVYSAAALASLLANSARTKQENGYQPLVISARPKPASGSETRFSSDVNSLVLERN